jgi:hypothetical protein
MEIDRIRINAAIERLLGGTDTWEVDARFVIQECRDLRKRSFFRLTINKPATTDEDEGFISGHAPGIGDVTIRNRQPKEKSTEPLFESGITRERMGHFKVWREATHEIGFMYWWKAHLSTQTPDDEEPTEYFIGSTPEGEPAYVGILRERYVFSTFLSKYYRAHLLTFHT